MNSNIIYDIHNLSFTWSPPKAVKNSTAKYIIQNFTAQLCGRQLAACIGKNGSGKSTFLKILAGLNRRYEGDVTFCGMPLAKCRPRELARQMSYMSQMTAEVPPFTVREIVDMGNYAKADRHDKAQTDANTDNAMRLANITVNPNTPFRELSGGWQQRVLIARAICQSVGVMLLDEPLSGLDIVCKDKMMSMLRSVTDTQDSLIVISTHDIDLAVQYADCILAFYGTTPQIFDPAELNDEKIQRIFAEP